VAPTAQVLDSGRDHSADEALVIAPVLVNGRIAMAAGATVTGRIQEVTAAVNPDDPVVRPWPSPRSAMRAEKRPASRPNSPR